MNITPASKNDTNLVLNRQSISPQGSTNGHNDYDEASVKSSMEEMVVLNKDKYPSVEPIQSSAGSRRKNSAAVPINQKSVAYQRKQSYPKIESSLTTVPGFQPNQVSSSPTAVPAPALAKSSNLLTSPKLSHPRPSKIFSESSFISQKDVPENGSSSIFGSSTDQYIMLKKEVSWILTYERTIEELISYLAAMSIYVNVWYVHQVYPEMTGIQWYKDLPPGVKDSVLQKGFTLATGLMTVAIFYSWLLRCGLKVHPIFRWTPLFYINLCFWYIPMSTLYLFGTYWAHNKHGLSEKDVLSYMPLNGLSLAMAMVHYPLRLLTFRIPLNIKILLFIIQIVYPLIGFPICMGWDLFQIYKWECLLTAACGVVCNVMAFTASHAASFYRNVVIENQIFVAKRNEALNFEIGEEKKAQEVLKHYTAYLFHEVRVPLNAVVFGLDNLRQMLTDIFERTYNNILPTTTEKAKPRKKPPKSTRFQLILYFMLEPPEPINDDETWDNIWDTLQDLEISSNRSKIILNRVLDFHSLESGLLKMSIKPFDLLEAVKDVVQMLKPISVNKEILVKIELHGNGFSSKPMTPTSCDAKGKRQNNEPCETVCDNGLVIEGIPEKPLIILWDCSRYQELLSNFLSNALKYTPIGGKVRVRLDAEYIEDKVAGSVGGYVSYKSPVTGTTNRGERSVSAQDIAKQTTTSNHAYSESKNNHSNEVGGSSSDASNAGQIPTRLCNIKTAVLDNGPGLSRRDQEKLFKPFSQINHGTKENHGTTQGKISSTGLGLVICKKIIELSNGRIIVDSEKGKGSSFTFELTLPSVSNLASSQTLFKSPEPVAKSLSPSSNLGDSHNFGNARANAVPNSSVQPTDPSVKLENGVVEEDEAHRLNSLFNFHLGDVIQDSIRNNSPHSPKRIFSSLRPKKLGSSDDMLNGSYSSNNSPKTSNPLGTENIIPPSQMAKLKEEHITGIGTGIGIGRSPLAVVQSLSSSSSTPTPTATGKSDHEDDKAGNAGGLNFNNRYNSSGESIQSNSRKSSAPRTPNRKTSIISMSSDDGSSSVPSTNIKVRVLIADDDAINAKLISYNLNRSGCVCVTVPDGQKALEILRSSTEGFHVILLDRNMPIMNGVEVLQKLKANEAWKKIKVIGISGGLTEEQEEFKSHGIDKVLVKPIKVEDLHTAIQELVSKPQHSN